MPASDLRDLGTVAIETKRLTLRKLWFDDAQAMFDNWASDPEATMYLTWKPYTDVKDVLKFIGDVNNEYITQKKYLWAICLRSGSGKDIPIGTIGFHNINEEIKDCEVGYVIGRKWWGRGIMPEALRAVMDYMFARVGMESIRAMHDTRNPNSGWVMEKCGMKYDGTLRHYSKNNAGPCDCAAYSILREEWEELI